MQSTWGIVYTPWKINMEPKHGGGRKMTFLFNWVMFRFHGNFQGCVFQLFLDCFTNYLIYYFHIDLKMPVKQQKITFV